MEDEDGESKIIDMWNILEEQQLKDSTLSNALRHSIDDVYANVIEEEKQLIAYNSIVRKESPGRNTVAGPKLAFKGFKKRILAQTREVHNAVPWNSAPDTQQQATTPHPNARSGRDRRAERKRERKIAEYTQYLGLQPSARNRCSKCHAWSNGDPHPKQQSSCACNSSMTPMPSTSESTSATLSHASNFKRKVYLCSACKMYYENWNMFLHMREIHKRHICLFCLGMFGHAERLLHHLVKKHNVPEIPFATAGDFHNSFEGSCYLVCCDCEKVFSETDDFFSHYCTSTLAQEATDTGTSVCTICRQTGTHASTCNFALLSDMDRESYGAATPLTVADTTRADNASPAAVPLPEKTNLGGKGLPRKGMKHARNRHDGNGMQSTRPQKLNALTRKLDANARCNETQPDCDHDVQREVANSLARDTVTETIMEVSRYTGGGDSSDENDENDEQAVNKDVCNSRDRGLDEKSPIQNCQLDRSEPYDSVTETIMEVSRYTGEGDKIERREDSTRTPNTLASHHEKMDTESEETCDRSNIDPARSTSSKAPSPARSEAEETTPADAKANSTCESKIESEFQTYSSPQSARSPSPVNRSLFSPQHESHVSDPQSKEEEEEEEEERFEDKEQVEVKKEDKPNATVESQVIFSAVASSDRSLVIKICNRNSQFSVATTTTASREPEKSNAEGSKEKILNGADKEENIGEDQANELDDSDSDSDKLAVVDSNPEDDEEGEEADEEPEDGRDDAKDRSRESQEGNGGDYGTAVDGFALVEPSGENVGEKFTSSEIEGSQTVSVANDQARSQTIGDDGIALAGEDVPFIDLNVEGTLDSMELEELLKRCIEAASPFCVYCNHARYIAVNGKQLSLHMLAEHKFQPQHPAIIIHAEQFIARVKKSLDELESRHFNLDTYDSTNGTYNVPSVLIYECFQCRFHSTVHKELYLHNRKMHQKTILKCIMCKSTFYSYSELVCHLCPGVYSPNVNLRYRCCLCSTTSLPSTFRLMVHLRKRHHVCDVCLEFTGNQQRLSGHVWKHKLNHLCYRCGIAYRNKPDITKHLFWKHGTESVLCRKCLQKKWPHVYHFCIPPTAFVCEECGSSFARAVALKVHKRLHSGDSPYNCDVCTERFISKKLLAKHQAAHREPEPEDVYVNVTDVVNDSVDKDERSDKDAATTAIDSTAVTGVAVEAASKSVKEAVKRVVDVYDLPPLNLSSESDTDSEEEKIATAEKPEKEKIDEDIVTEKKSEIVEETVVAADDDNVTALTNDIIEVERNEEEKKQEARIMDGIWDNFKTYAASLDVEESAKNVALKESVPETDAAYLRSIVLADHDYHVVYCDKEKSEDAATTKDDDGTEQQHDVKGPERTPSPSSPSRNADGDASKRKTKTPKKKKRSGSTSSTSDSSSDSDSSSCSCGTNCSCSSSSSGSSSSSSSSSDSDSSTSESSPRKQSSGRKDRKKEREAARENKSQSAEPENKPEDKAEITIENGAAVPEITIESPTPPPKLLLRESDLETDETETTDEDFYDEHPQLLANQLAEKRNQLQLLAAVAPASTPTSLPAMEQPSTPLNNGVLDVETMLPEMTIMDQQPRQPQQQKRKAKTKKRRKGERANKRSNAINATVESIKLNIPKAFYQKNSVFAVSSPAVLHSNSRSSTPSLMPAATCNDFHSDGGASVTMEMMQQQQQAPLAAATTPVIGMSNPNAVIGGSETENKRVSKRKHVPKRFYGDSSDDEPRNKQPMFGRWRKVKTAPSTPVFTPLPPTAMMASAAISKPTVPPTKLSFGIKTITPVYNRQHAHVEQTVGQQETLPEASPIAAAASTTESEDPAGSSSDSSESETEDTRQTQPKSGHNAAPITTPPAVNAPAVERPVKIYCYCQCPYDEVSEMIACDGEDCRIEWFHFECVGIMVPPKGKWYCPDCRKKHGIVQNNDDYCD